MKEERVARDYAQALLATTAEDWLGSLKDIQARLEALEPDVVSSLDDPDLSFARKESLLKKVLPARLPAGAANFVRVLARDNRVSSLSGIIRELEALGRWGPGVGIVHVTSAAPLTNGEISALKGKVSDRWGERLDFRFHVDPALLGGVVVRLDDKVIDGSVEGRLRSLRRHLEGRA